MENIKRVNLTGNWEAVTFSNMSKSYFIKNFSEDPIYVSFQQGDTEDTSCKINSNMAEQLDCVITSPSPKFYSDTIYIKGTGEVEIEQLWVTK